MKPQPHDDSTWWRDPSGPAGTRLTYEASLAGYNRAMQEIDANPRERGEHLKHGGMTYRPKLGQTLAQFEAAFKAGQFHLCDLDGADEEFIARSEAAHAVVTERAKKPK